MNRLEKKKWLDQVKEFFADIKEAKQLIKDVLRMQEESNKLLKTGNIDREAIRRHVAKN